MLWRQQAIESLVDMPQQLGRYQVRRKVGEGGMGVVYEGYDPHIARRVALKAIKPEYVAGPEAGEFLRRLKREAQAAGGLSHPNIVAVYDYCEDFTQSADGRQVHTPFIVMEYIEGRELASYLKSHERFSLPDIQRIMGEILDALGYSHVHGVVHRDIKPGNIILLEDGTVKVADFGIARNEASTLTRVGAVMGSPHYMAPEQFNGHAVDARCDLYAAGLIFYQLLVGKLPFSGAPAVIMHKSLHEQPTPPSVLSVSAPKACDKIIRRALAKRPDERFQRAAEFKQAIMAVQPVSIVVPRQPGAQRSSIVRRTAVGALALSLGLAVFFSSRPFHSQPSVSKQAAASLVSAPEQQLIRSASASPTALPDTARRAAEPQTPNPAEPAATAQQVSAPALVAKTAARIPQRKSEIPDARCSELLQKASLEPLRPDEASILVKNCR